MRLNRGQVHHEQEKAEFVREQSEPQEDTPRHALNDCRKEGEHRLRDGGPVQHLLYHCRDYRRSDHARRFDGKKHIATVTEHATHQTKEFARRFDGKKYIINEDNCAEHRHKKLHEKMPGAITDEEWKFNGDDDERQQTIYSQHSTNENEGLIESMNQMLELENTRRFEELYGNMLGALTNEEFARRFDGKTYLITVDDCTVHRHKKFYGKMPGAITDEEFKLTEEDDEKLQTIYSQHST